MEEGEEGSELGDGGRLPSASLFSNQSSLSPPQGPSPFLGPTGQSAPLPSMSGRGCLGAAKPPLPLPLPEIDRMWGGWWEWWVTHTGRGIWELEVPPPSSGHPDLHLAQSLPPQDTPLSHLGGHWHRLWEKKNPSQLLFYHFAPVLSLFSPFPGPANPGTRYGGNEGPCA